MSAGIDIPFLSSNLTRALTQNRDSHEEPLRIMTEIEVIREIRENVEGQFPKVCPFCRRTFATIREFLLTTKPLGPVVSYDAELGDWNPADPIGTMAFANCPCGDTLVVSSEAMPRLRLWSILNWVRDETILRNQSPHEIFSHLRDQITQQIMQKPAIGVVPNRVGKIYPSARA